MNREQRRAELKSQAKTKEYQLKADIGYNKETEKVVIVYGRQINNVSYSLDQLDYHIKGLIGAARMLEFDFMDEVKL